MQAGRSIWILAGQSNMQGCGLRGRPVPPDPRVSTYLPEIGWRPARDPLESATPMDPPEPGVSLGPAFGRELADLIGSDIGLVPTAVGGTLLDQWSPANRNDPASLYGRMLLRARAACESAGTPPSGVLWYQGESDAGDLRLAKTYAARLTAFLEELRRDLGRPGLLVVLVQIGRFVTPVAREAEADLHRAWDLVRAAIAAVAEADPRCTLTSAIDLELSDCIHLSAPALHRLGQRLARLAAGLAGDPKIPRTGPRLIAAREEPYHPQMGFVRLRFTGVDGGWRHPVRITGFSACDGDGCPHPTHRVVEVTPLHEADDLGVVLNLPIDPTVRLAYGLGCNPVAALTDRADAPLAAFGPASITA